MSYIYLASPYSGTPEEMQNRYEKAFNCAGHLLRRGVHVHSSIVHCHYIAKAFDLPTNAEFWKKYNASMLRYAYIIYVLKIPGWKESGGVAAEITMAKTVGIPIALVSEEGGFLENI